MNHRFDAMRILRSRADKRRWSRRLVDDETREFVDLVSAVHLKVLLLAWAYDRTYSYVDRLFNGPLQYSEHRYRLAGGRFSGNGDGGRALG